MDSIATSKPEFIMMHSTHTHHHLNTVRHTPSPTALVTLLSSWLLRWLLRCWQAQCRQAERPGRIVPRY